MVLGARTATLSQDDSLKGGGAPLTLRDVVTAISVVLVGHRSDQNQRGKGILPRLQLAEVHQRPSGVHRMRIVSTRRENRTQADSGILPGGGVNLFG